MASIATKPITKTEFRRYLSNPKEDSKGRLGTLDRTKDKQQDIQVINKVL